MAFPAGLTDRSDEMRFRNAQQSPRDEHPTFPSLASPLRGIGSQMQQAHTPTASDARGSLHRRFTTNTVPTLPTLSPLSPIGQQRRQAAENSDYSTAVSACSGSQTEEVLRAERDSRPLAFIDAESQPVELVRYSIPSKAASPFPRWFY